MDEKEEIEGHLEPTRSMYFNNLGGGRMSSSVGQLGRSRVIPQSSHLRRRCCGNLPSSTQKLPEGAIFIRIELGGGGCIIRRKALCVGKFMSLFSFVLFGGTWRHIRGTLMAHHVEVPCTTKG